MSHSYPKDHLVSFANWLCARHAIMRGGLGEAERAIVKRVVDPLVVEFAGYIRERDELATRGEFTRRFVWAISRAGSAPSLRGRWDHIQAMYALDTFPPDAADGIDLNGQLELSGVGA